MDVCWRIGLFGYLRAEREGVAITRFRSRRTAALCGALDGDAFAAAWSEGQALSLDRAIPHALEETGEG